MFKHASFIIGILSVALCAQAQNVKYKDFIFTNVTITKDLSYNPSAIKKEKKFYQFDLFQPRGDNSTGRPLIIWMHGGGFKFGTKAAKGVQLWSKTFAQRGYVCADINYRLSKHNPLFHFDELLKSTYFAVQDAKMAVEYFKHHYKEYGIDPNKIILGGNSAGGMIAMQAAYSSNEELAKMAGLSNDTAAVSKPGERVKIAAVINFWGAIYNLNWLKNSRVPIVTALGSNDGLVVPTHKSAPLYGGEDIHTTADSLHIPNKIKIFEGYSHELQKHFNPIFPVGSGTEQRWLQAGQFAADFLYNSLFK
jgi:poly(3-hydroxybutyrate) depolymerase